MSGRAANGGRRRGSLPWIREAAVGPSLARRGDSLLSASTAAIAWPIFRVRPPSEPRLPAVVKLPEHRADAPPILRQLERLVRPHRDHDIVAGRELMPIEPVRFAEQPADAIASHRVAHAPRRGEAETRVGQIVRQGVHDERPAAAGDPLLVDAVELAPIAQAERLREALIGRGGGHQSTWSARW
ncbi:MAG: hypothetical protein V2J24_16780, partial [Pseudomonadales bacterium]|nr:hypothetical protein [Pseudomonadales bacterium]